MKTSEQLDQIFLALANAAAEFPKIERGCTAKVYPKKEGAQPYSYDYADLDDVLSAVRGPLAKNGVTLSHDAKLVRDPLCLEVTARLEHASGQFKESEALPMPLEGTMSLAQQIGSAYTYGRRYTSQAILGISTEADDDGHGAGDQHADTGRKKSEPKPACPKCHKSEFVGEDREVSGRFFCWKNADKQKFGCGHKWDSGVTDEATAAENGKQSEVKKLASEHGMKTGDQIPRRDTKAVDFAFLKAKLDAFDSAAPDAAAKLGKADDVIYQALKSKAISDAEKQQLDFLVAEIQQAIDRNKNRKPEPATA